MIWQRSTFMFIVFIVLHAVSAVTVDSLPLPPNEKPVTSVKRAVVEAYVKGIHTTQDEKTAKAGFHEDFAMLVQDNGDIRKVTVEEWLNFISQEAKMENPELWNSRTTYAFESVDVTENAASVKIQIYKGDKHFSTDYMLLYRFDEGWKIVSKIFSLH